MIARLDHHPMLTALLALTTAVLAVVVIALATLLITSRPAVSPTTTTNNVGGANPAAGAAAVPGDGLDAGGKGYGPPVEAPAQTGNGADSAPRYDYYQGHLK